MKSRLTYKDIKIDDRIYRVNKMDARTACWLYTTLAGRTENGRLLSALSKMSRVEFDEIQLLVLRQISSITTVDGQEMPIPIIGAGNLWADKVLQENPEEVFALTTESIEFNLSPFLSEKG